jgi:uncharacterized protein (TIGR02246 family)
MTTHDSKLIAEAQIRDLIQSWQSAAASRDIDKVMSHYAPDILSFDAIGLLQYKGRDAYKKHWQACFEMCPGDEGSFQINDLAVTAGDEIGFAHYLASCGGPGPDGEVKAGFMRGTVCCRKVDGKWLVAHEHLSVPFDMESGKALTELTP